MTSSYKTWRKIPFQRAVTLEQIDDFFTELPVTKPSIAPLIEYDFQSKESAEEYFQQITSPKSLFQLACEVATLDLRVLSVCKTWLPRALFLSIKRLLPINEYLRAKSGNLKCVVCEDSGLYSKSVSCRRCERLEKRAIIRSLLRSGQL